MGDTTPAQTRTLPQPIPTPSPPLGKGEAHRHRHHPSTKSSACSPGSSSSSSSSKRISPHDKAKADKKGKPVIYGPMKVSDINSPGPKEGPFANLRLPSSTTPWRAFTSEGVVHTDKFARWTDGPSNSSGSLGSVDDKPNGKLASIKSINGVPVSSSSSPNADGLSSSKVKPNHGPMDT